jgi:hypothetical protein
MTSDKGAIPLFSKKQSVSPLQHINNDGYMCIIPNEPLGAPDVRVHLGPGTWEVTGDPWPLRPEEYSGTYRCHAAGCTAR